MRGWLIMLAISDLLTLCSTENAALRCSAPGQAYLRHLPARLEDTAQRLLIRRNSEVSHVHGPHIGRHLRRQGLIGAVVKYGEWRAAPVPDQTRGTIRESKPPSRARLSTSLRAHLANFQQQMGIRPSFGCLTSWQGPASIGRA